MATLVRQKSSYYLQFFHPRRDPQRKKISLHTKKKADALITKADLETRYHRGEIDPWVDELRPPGWVREEAAVCRYRKLGEAVDAFLASRAACRRATRDHYRWVLESLVAFVGRETEAAAVDSATLLRWLTSEPRSPQTHRTNATEGLPT